MRSPLRIAVALALLLAALSLLLPYDPVYDPWAWLVWGREAAGLELSTSAGPSWKPLPVLVDAPLSLLGDGAPQAWLFVSRGGWLLAPVLAGWLAARLTGPQAGRWRWAAAGLAGASVALTWDSFTPALRQFSGGLSEPLAASFVLGAILAALARRPSLALWLGVGASLLRPEAWPFLALWAALELRRTPALRRQAVAAALAVLAAWFVPDLVGSGNPLEGSDTARRGGLELWEAFEVAGRTLAAPLAALWVGVALLVPECRREPRGTAAILLAGSLAWVAVVAVMAVIGFAGLPRFLAPATAVLAALGAAGLAGAGARSLGGPRREGLAALVAVALLTAVAGIGLRVAQLPDDVRTVREQADSMERLFALADRVGRERLLSCGGRVRLTELLGQTALAWKLEAPIEKVKVRRRPRHGVVVSTERLGRGVEIDRVGQWRATQLPCQGAAVGSSTSGRDIAGVSGAAR